MIKKWSVTIFDNKKGRWPQRGVRVLAHTREEATAIARERKHIPETEKCLVHCHQV